MENNNRSTLIIGIVVLILLVVAGMLAFSGSSEDATTDIDNNTGEFQSVSGDEANSVIVRDQLPGSVVFYENLILEENGFVVVREDAEGEPGEVIGSMFVESGENMTGNVELDSDTEEGEFYYVELYNDTNENDVFDEGQDEPIVTSGGDQIRVRIEATENLPEQKG